MDNQEKSGKTAEIPADLQRYIANGMDALTVELLIDRSESMGRTINGKLPEEEPNVPTRFAQLNVALEQFAEQAAAFSRTEVGRVALEIGVLLFNSRLEPRDFVPAAHFKAPLFEPKDLSGRTHLGSALKHAVLMLRRRKAAFLAHNIRYRRSHLVVLSDCEIQGEPIAELFEAIGLLRDEARNNSNKLIAVRLPGSREDVLEQIALVGGEIVDAKDFDFSECFLRLSVSLEASVRGGRGGGHWKTSLEKARSTHEDTQ